MPTLWSRHYAQRTQRMQDAPIREVLQATDQAHMISFAGEWPASDTLPLTQVHDAWQCVVAEHGPYVLQDSLTAGYRSRWWRTRWRAGASWTNTCVTCV